MASTLLIRIEGPLQAWGAEGAALTRPTRTEPTFSGIIGLLANALGCTRDEDLTDLAGLRFGVRCDRPGTVVRDYHTAGAGPFPRTSARFPGGVMQANGKIPSDPDRRLVPTERYLVSDAAFLCGLEGDDALIDELDNALATPARPLFLGRKANPPSAPIRLRDGLLRHTGMVEALAGYPLLPGAGPPDGGVRTLITSGPGEPWDQVVRDMPVGAAFATRRFLPRRVRTVYLQFRGEELPASLVDPEDPLEVWVPGEIVA